MTANHTPDSGNAHQARPAATEHQTSPASPHTLHLHDLKRGQRVRNLLPQQEVTIIMVDPDSTGFAEIFFRTSDGKIKSIAITDQEVAQLEIVTAENAAPKLDADANEFKLAAEALRIKYAALYDPMAAVNSSNIQPLPHQIRAVYEELLPKIPLRFLLADDPGAGKTIMAGLYIKELMLRSVCQRAIIVAPGSLVEQWREELAEKFDLHFEVFGRQMVDDAHGRNPFADHPYLIVRMDQVSRDEELLQDLEHVRWDVAIVDEAHRMSAHFNSWQGEVKETQRFKLGRILSRKADNFLLMTATPHPGKEEDFQLFMSLLDADRYSGRFREGVHRTDTKGLMRRMVKEDLKTFEGKALFPERRAYTVSYELSPDERELYEEVTAYVRTEMGRAEKLQQSGNKKRGNNVGFALTVLQRRLASSPQAILRSLERRQNRLEELLKKMEDIARSGGDPEAAALTDQYMAEVLPERSLADYDDLDEETSEDERAEFEEQTEEIVDLATAAKTIPELKTEIAVLKELVTKARAVYYRGDDKKWSQLRTILDRELLTPAGSNEIRKLIVFTEHRDTLEYLQNRIKQQLGRSDAVITIHGGTSRAERKVARERFTHDPEAVVLVATDAAGEGMNLQRAHLMVNYDLPWNPNRIEQRFGRIHRIGQREVCHLWNLVAADTREGDVFQRLLGKIETIGKAFNGNLFNVLGEDDAFRNRPLRDLLIQAIRYGDDPRVKAQLDEIIDRSVSNGLQELVNEKSLFSDITEKMDIDAIRRRMELARERRLQPGYIEAFFFPAFKRLGGRIFRREAARYEITRVPQRLRDIARDRNRWLPLPERYERVTFQPDQTSPDGLTDAELIAPGNPLLDAVIEATIADLGDRLQKGTILVDHRSKQGREPVMMYAVEQRIQNGLQPPALISHHFDYVMLDQQGNANVFATPPYLEFDAPSEAEKPALAQIANSEWVRASHERQVASAAFEQGLKPRLEELNALTQLRVQHTREQVNDRLVSEINHWYQQSSLLEEDRRRGKELRMQPEEAVNRIAELDLRRKKRNDELDAEARLITLPPRILSSVLVVPSSLLPTETQDQAQLFARDTAGVERRAVDAVLRAETALGHRATEMDHLNPGYDVRTELPDGRVLYIEVKGRIEGTDTFTISKNEVAFAQSQADHHLLALVRVSKDSPAQDELRYVTNAFSSLRLSDSTASYNEKWRAYWDRGFNPLGS